MISLLSPSTTRNRIGLVFAALVLITANPALGQVLISQETITGEQDYGSGFGQSFLVPTGAELSAIELHIGSPGRGGGSAAARLWEATGAPGSNLTREGAEPVATGLLEKQDVTDTPGWFVFQLDQDYVNNTGAPVYLVFEVELLTSGADGWNNYSFSDQDNYADGHSVRWSGSQYSIRNGEDLAFRILGREASPPIPLPKIKLAVSKEIQLVTIVVPVSVEGFRYICYRTSVFTYRTQVSSTESGDGAPIVWFLQFMTGLPDREFYFVEVTPEPD